MKKNIQKESMDLNQKLMVHFREKIINKTNPEERKRERNTPEILIFGTSLEKLKTQKRKPQKKSEIEVRKRGVM